MTRARQRETTLCGWRNHRPALDKRKRERPLLAPRKKRVVEYNSATGCEEGEVREFLGYCEVS
jgi:hypothetical protein